MKTIKIGDFEISNKKKFFLIAGPCVIESESHSIMMAEKIATVCQKLKINFIYKSSFDKANRSSINSNRGIEINQAEKIFNKIKSTFNCPILTDVHNESQCEFLSKSQSVDIIQIPAFLCRQTDLLLAAGKTGKTINIKKGQFVAPGKMTFAAEKVSSTGNKNILLTERGTSFGYD